MDENLHNPLDKLFRDSIEPLSELAGNMFGRVLNYTWIKIMQKRFLSWAGTSLPIRNSA